MDINDEEALFKYYQANEEAELKNKYYRGEDYALICLGVLNMEGESNEVGIIYDYKKDYPFVFDSVSEDQKPKHNQKYFESMKTNKEREEELKLKSLGGE